MKRKELTKIYMTISNWKNPLVSMTDTKIFQNFRSWMPAILYSSTPSPSCLWQVQFPEWERIHLATAGWPSHALSGYGNGRNSRKWYCKWIFHHAFGCTWVCRIFIHFLHERINKNENLILRWLNAVPPPTFYPTTLRQHGVSEWHR